MEVCLGSGLEKEKDGEYPHLRRLLQGAGRYLERRASSVEYHRDAQTGLIKKVTRKELLKEAARELCQDIELAERQHAGISATPYAIWPLVTQLALAQMSFSEETLELVPGTLGR